MPGAVPAKLWRRPPTFPFKQMELIDIFITKAKEFGVPEHESFQTCDLYEEQNLFQVLMCLQSLGRKVHFHFIFVRTSDLILMGTLVTPV